MTAPTATVLSGEGDLAAASRSGTDYVVVVRDGARLRPDGLRTLLGALERFPVDAAYGDSRERVGRRRRLVERPDFSPLRFRRQDFLGDVVALRTDWLRDGGWTGIRDAVEAADPGRVLHVPAPLADRSTARVPERRDAPAPGDAEPLVSIVIPTRGSAGEVAGRRSVYVADLIRAILERSPYTALEFVVVADDATPQEVVDELVALPGEVRLVRWSAPFNFSAKINRGAVHARGDLLLLLNDDIQPISDDWIRTMVDLLAEGDGAVGAVGATLLYEDGTLQHAGHLYEAESAGHVAHEKPAGWDDALGTLAVDREMSGASAACLLVSRDLFHGIGGMSALLPGNYNDVDLCLKIRSAGRSVVVTPRALLHHYESRTRDARVAVPESDALRRRWRSRIEADGYWPPASGR